MIGEVGPSPSTSAYPSYASDAGLLRNLDSVIRFDPEIRTVLSIRAFPCWGALQLLHRLGKPHARWGCQCVQPLPVIDGQPHGRSWYQRLYTFRPRRPRPGYLVPSDDDDRFVPEGDIQLRGAASVECHCQTSALASSAVTADTSAESLDDPQWTSATSARSYLGSVGMASTVAWAVILIPSVECPISLGEGKRSSIRLHPNARDCRWSRGYLPTND